jgi:hypothetical protein
MISFDIRRRIVLNQVPAILLLVPDFAPGEAHGKHTMFYPSTVFT